MAHLSRGERIPQKGLLWRNRCPSSPSSRRIRRIRGQSCLRIPIHSAMAGERSSRYQREQFSRAFLRPSRVRSPSITAATARARARLRLSISRCVFTTTTLPHARPLLKNGDFHPLSERLAPSSNCPFQNFTGVSIAPPRPCIAGVIGGLQRYVNRRRYRLIVPERRRRSPWQSGGALLVEMGGDSRLCRSLDWFLAMITRETRATFRVDIPGQEGG